MQFGQKQPGNARCKPDLLIVNLKIFKRLLVRMHTSRKKTSGCICQLVTGIHLKFK